MTQLFLSIPPVDWLPDSLIGLARTAARLKVEEQRLRTKAGSLRARPDQSQSNEGFETGNLAFGRFSTQADRLQARRRLEASNAPFGNVLRSLYAAELLEDDEHRAAAVNKLVNTQREYASLKQSFDDLEQAIEDMSKEPPSTDQVREDVFLACMEELDNKIVVLKLDVDELRLEIDGIVIVVRRSHETRARTWRYGSSWA